MKKFFALMAVVLAVVSCQKDVDNLDVNVGGAVDTVITVNIPENETRANDSGIGVFENGVLDGDATMRYIFQVYYNGETNTESRQVKYTDGTSISFPVRLVPGRDYQFVVWADVVTGENAGDNHYNTTDLKNITLNTSTWVAMDETRDAFTATYEAKQFNGAQTINIDLYRPFAKLRVVTTDYVALKNHGTGIKAKTATVKYSTEHRSAFNAYTSKAEAADLSGVEHENYIIATYSLENDAKRTIFSDYFFAEDDVVKFEMTVYDTNGDEIVTRVFNTDIYAKRNHLTTLLGNILTDGNDINVEVKPGFGGTENPNINYNVITSGAELIKAIENGGSYMVGNDIYVSAPVASTLATRAAAVEPTTTTINLNGYTITINNNDQEALVELHDNDALIFSGEGKIEGTGTGQLVNGGTVVVTGEAEVDEDAVADNVVVGEDALKYVIANGGEFTMTNDLTFSEILAITAKNPVVIDGNGKTITSSASRAINVDGATADVTIKNLNIVASEERAINVINNSKKVTIENVTATAANYTVNVAGSAPGAVVAIKNSTLNGLCTVNVASAGVYVTVDGSTVNCNDNNTTAGESYAALCLNKAAVGAKIIATNSTINVTEGSDSTKGRNGAEDGEVTINGGVEGVVVTKAVITYPGSDYYYGFETIQEAVEFAESGDVITLIRNVELTEALIIDNGKTLTLDLNGKTVAGTDTITGSFGLITNKGNLTITGNGKITLVAKNNRGWNAYSSVISNNPGGNLVVENVTIEHLGGTDMAYGIDNLTNGKGTSAVANINDGAVVKSCYRAIRQFLNGVEATNTLAVNAGAVIEGTNKSIWMQDPSKNANTGKLVVNEGATLKGNAYLTVTEGSTEWPVEVSIADAAFEGESTLLSNNVPAGYEVVEKDGIWTVKRYTKVSTADELVAALAAGEGVFFKNDITVAASNGGYNKAGILQNKAQTIDGNGYTLTVTGAGATWDCAIYTNGGTIKNLTVAGAMRGIFTAGQSSDLNIENVTFKNVIYTFNSDGNMPAKPFGVYVSNSIVNGWTSHSNMHTEVVYTNCSFGEGSGYKFCRPYGKTEFINCTFCPGYTVDQSKTTEITFTDCTWEE